MIILRYLKILSLVMVSSAMMIRDKQLHPQIELRVSSSSWTSITHSAGFKSSVLQTGKIQIIIPRLTFEGDSISVFHLDKLLSKCGMVVLIIELPNVDDTMPVFTCLQDLGPVQVCATLKVGTMDLNQEAVLSNVRYITDRLIAFSIDLFIDTRMNLSPDVRVGKILEVELCGTDITMLDEAQL